MPLPPQVISFGALEEQIGGLRWRLRPNDFDSCFYSVDSTNEAFVSPGAAMPGYPIMRAVDVAANQLGDVWVFDAEYKGFKSAAETWRLFQSSENSPSEGFDNISMVIGTRTPDDPIFARGELSPLAGPHPQMYIMDVAKEPTEIAGYTMMNLQLRGQIGNKPYTRRINTATQTFSPSAPWTAADQINGNGDPIYGWTAEGAQPAEFTIPRTTLTDSFVTITEPPFNGIPGNVLPENRPLLTEFTFWTSGGYRYHWPYGWRRASISSEQLPGRNVWFVSITYEAQQKILPE
jgi:hypothetical protein